MVVQVEEIQEVTQADLVVHLEDQVDLQVEVVMVLPY